jgi:ubiquinone/menaquinone biosynthesis C-methylase UbiE
MDGQNLELEATSFDVAASNFGLMFLPDTAQGLRKLHRVVRPGG